MIVITGRTTTTIVGASLLTMVLAAPASPQSDRVTQGPPEPFLPWLMRVVEPPAPVEPRTPPMPRPRHIQQPANLPAAAQSRPTPAVAHMHEQAIQPPPTYPREQSIQQSQRI